jgi:triosephosphate isomerase (TIM)
MRRPFVVGNWKMNGTSASLTEAAAIAAHARTQPSVDVALCPPATLLSRMVDAVAGLPVGGQDCHEAAKGAFTGSIAASMLREAGAALVIVGHSERRTLLEESDSLVQAKAMAALAAGLSVILCIGEPLEVRDAGAAEAYVLAQLSASLPTKFVAADGDAPQLAIAYEPIWAIGTGRTPSLEDIANIHAAIRASLGDKGATMRLLYGGSVNASNAADILALSDVDGALVGGASLTLDAFAPIIDAAAPSTER